MHASLGSLKSPFPPGYFLDGRDCGQLTPNRYGSNGFCVSDEVLSCLRQERSKHENPVQNVVTVTAQEPAYLHCRIPEGSNHMVAWTRSSDQALLTAGQHSFTSDPRFQRYERSFIRYVIGDNEAASGANAVASIIGGSPLDIIVSRQVFNDEQGIGLAEASRCDWAVPTVMRLGM
ncbi:hypothetical protein NECAME_04440 [Necator americanus]|uniref:Ig-like domain-containing protein n=1 Tax=Necator americanus TaxID=51031 RepID=W2SSQ0_NECAM|nr:hypothetical protein NECAME_04440 [Necator americanus]ETN72543.1 hypothetical protein NECAME_04440 [Necator americanus]